MININIYKPTLVYKDKIMVTVANIKLAFRNMDSCANVAKHVVFIRDRL